MNHGNPKRWKVERSALVSAVNAAGRLLGGKMAGELTAEAVIGAARRQGAADLADLQSFREPLRRLTLSMEGEARLNFLGRMAARHDLVRLLATRWGMKEDRKRHPGITEEVIRRPVFITGLPRTGTTLLHNLLALDPASRVPFTWETLYPSPPPEAATRDSDRRIGVVDGQLRWFRRMVKGFDRIHPVGARLPEECLVIFSYSFLSYQFETTHRLPSYLAWLEEQDLRPAYDMHRRFLQHLQWRCPGERWVLKAPAHLFDFEALFSVYPDACVVMTHRDPLEAAASNASLTATLRTAFSDDVDPFEVGPECSRRWAGAVGKAMRSRDRGCAPAERFLDIYYADLVADPVGSVRKVYDSFGMTFTEGLEEKIRGFLSRNPKGKFGKHKYSLEEFGLDREEENARYAAYRQRFRL